MIGATRGDWCAAHPDLSDPGNAPGSRSAQVANADSCPSEPCPANLLAVNASSDESVTHERATATIDLPNTSELNEGAAPLGRGYDPGFLGPRLAPAEPRPGSDSDDAVLLHGQPWLPYEHFAVMLSRTRRLARQVAWNIDVQTLREGDDVSRSGIPFRADPRIPAEAQTLDDVYARNRLDRGHIARRADLLWGADDVEVERANRESFYFPNITPQMDSFNQSGREGQWGLLENSLAEYVRATALPRVSAFGGPVLAADDPEYRGVRVPLSFWKVLAYRVDGELRCRAFILTQSLDGLEPVTFDEEYLIHGVPLGDLQERTDLLFGPELLAADRLGAGVRPSAELVDDPYAVRW